jgi:hypothetical protein
LIVFIRCLLCERSPEHVARQSRVDAFARGSTNDTHRARVVEETNRKLEFSVDDRVMCGAVSVAPSAAHRAGFRRRSSDVQRRRP